MPLHILKLCVGAESIADLQGWVTARMSEMVRNGETPEQRHTTRMVPKRVPELLDGGSLYWIIKGQVAVRQALLGVRPFTDHDGIGRCHLVLDPAMVPVDPRPHRPFQGWRYLRPEDAPMDFGNLRSDLAAMPEPLRRELRELGLL
ncbi:MULTISPECIES: DUF1489 family protein [Lichenihabitans]|uniref:DUF1489 family protein n=1 Tax=Lichenihabitans TaxID=2723776 RepID=UPI001036084B|nr:MULTISPECIES: DUF1489 family protein [Lichenihabitans]UDL95050.1 DUF1489 family protein [Lichenihabitans sp. PAMC28606]